MNIRFACPAIFLFVVNFSFAAILHGESEPAVTKWLAGSGSWTNTVQWSNGSPDPYKHVEIHGVGTVSVPPGAYPLANLQIGKKKGDHTRVEIEGGQLVLLQDPLDLGDVTGSEAELILKDGALQNCVDTYVGGGMGVTGRASRGALIIHG